MSNASTSNRTCGDCGIEYPWSAANVDGPFHRESCGYYWTPGDGLAADHCGEILSEGTRVVSVDGGDIDGTVVRVLSPNRVQVQPLDPRAGVLEAEAVRLGIPV